MTMMMNSNYDHASSVVDSVQNVFFAPDYNPQTIENYYKCSQAGRCSNPEVKILIEKARSHLSATGWTFFYMTKKKSGTTKELRYRAPTGRVFLTLRAACECAINNPNQSKKRKHTEPVKDSESFSREDWPQKKICVEDVVSICFDQRSAKDTSVVDSEIKNETFSCNRPIKQIQDFKGLTGKKVAQKDKVSGTKKKGVLGSLIDNNIVEKGSRVSYLSRKDGTVMKRGRVYEDGIRCDCCDEMFLLTKFEAHAGSTNHRPAVNLFFDDDRSIFDCQTQLQLESGLPVDGKSTKPVITDVKSTQSVVTEVKSIKPVVTYVKSTKSSPCVAKTNDRYCSFCDVGGELLLCDSCTSSYHPTCIGLDCVPDSDVWFCPSCTCWICHQVQPNNVDDLIMCAQCEHHFHIGCINNLGCAHKWFCTEICERIYFGLMEIRGKVTPVNGGDLSWSLLKYDENDKDVCELEKNHGKLMKASKVMHDEYFVPVRDPLSDEDIIEDVIFSRATKRSYFKGFYTAVLEKNDEIITVVTLRIHGNKLAEIPFVATTLRYMRFRMCQLLMNKVERMIRRLGVERIVLPVPAEKVRTWTRSSFRFREMTDIERLDLVGCKFVDILGTKKCMKKLKKMSASL